MVVLADAPACFDEDFWFHVPSFVQGIGPSRKCLEPLATAEAFQVKAMERSLAVHVWTERPEFNYVSEYFSNLREELEYLLCEVGVDGVFTEDVATASLVINQENCKSRKVNTFEPTPAPTTAETISTPIPINSNSSIAQQPLQCSDGGLTGATASLAIAAGLMGIFIGVIVTISIMRSRLCKSSKDSRRQVQIPTVSMEDDHEMI